MNFSFILSQRQQQTKIQSQEFIPLEIVIVVLLPLLACGLHSSAQKHVSL